MLANNVGIIDETYRGNLLIPLVCIIPNSPPLELPFCKVQLIVKEAKYMDVKEVTDFKDDTERGEGGFGSTGARV